MKRFLSAAARIGPANAGGGVPPAPAKLSGSSARLVRQRIAAARPRPPARCMFQFRNFHPVPPDPAAGLSDESLVRPASYEAGPLLAQVEVRESTTWRPAGSATKLDEPARTQPTGMTVGTGQHCPVPTGRAVVVGSSGHRRCPVAGTATARIRGRKMMNDRQATRAASRERNDSTHRRSSAHLAAGRHASTGHLCAPGARRIRLIPGHPRRAGTFSLANRIRQGMCTRAPVRLRPLFAY
ncbi:hypothetical protein [Burkholderia ambifaria]|uniref:hypothetical protein n=1 Tax=Burkholderia ambifaria TaxID=152480 RepID=UPI001E5FCAB5|nr:hypothetical protein [Burkholderia ambifaria]